MNVLGPSLAPHVRSSRTLKKYVTPIAHWYADLMGYRKMGLKYDDLQVEESSQVQRAIGRLTPRETYDRAYRFKIASDCDLHHESLPKEQWTKPEDDKRYLMPHIVSVLEEEGERATWDTMTVQRK
ncbi:14 kDa subunit of cytochrome bd ubiquinol oxidase [Rhizopogon salebrosus TDB-379]|nr:14 kDa subunit of cytochrome bd ubiquinol oxidase [Rhizopogon salebrosus TDB-379]